MYFSLLLYIYSLEGLTFYSLIHDDPDEVLLVLEIRSHAAPGQMRRRM